MENTEVHYQMQIKTDFSTDSWNEKIEKSRITDEPKSDEEAIQFAKEIIDNFNDTLRHGEIRRELITVRRIETKVIDLIPIETTD